MLKILSLNLEPWHPFILAKVLHGVNKGSGLKSSIVWEPQGHRSAALPIFITSRFSPLPFGSNELWDWRKLSWIKCWFASKFPHWFLTIPSICSFSSFGMNLLSWKLDGDSLLQQLARSLCCFFDFFRQNAESRELSSNWNSMNFDKTFRAIFVSSSLMFLGLKI